MSNLFGFQGQESDSEIKGEGNSVNYKYRMHDPRLGRFFAVDPLSTKYPYWSPYVFSGNQVIHMIELEGLEPTIPPNADRVFPDGQEMGEESIEANLLPLTPLNANQLTFTFQYSNYGANNLTGYSTWQYDPIDGVWEGQSRIVYKNTKSNPRSWFESPPHGCVQNGNFLGDCYNTTRFGEGNYHFNIDPNSPGCPISLVDLSDDDITNLFNQIEQDARNAVIRTENQNTKSVNVSLNSTIYNIEDVKKMKQNLLKSGKFVGIPLNVSLRSNMTIKDGEGDPTQEVGGHVGRTIETKTQISDGNR